MRGQQGVESVNNVGDIAVDSSAAEAFSTDGMGINRREIRPGKTFNAVDISVDIICLDTGSHMS